MPTAPKLAPTAAEPPTAEALRRELAAVILALWRAATEAERERLAARRKELGRQLAHLVKTE